MVELSKYGDIPQRKRKPKLREGIGEYRGKRIDTQKWVEGNYVQLRGCKEHEDLHLIIDEHGEYHRIDPDTVGEYTGLNDDNDTKIFEGDIIRIVDKSNEFEFIAIVEFGNPNGLSSWGWQLNIITGGQDVNPDILCWVETEMPETTATEIIGNIHDNKRKEA